MGFLGRLVMKGYTDLEQSNKLARILPIESSDMWYHGHISPWESERQYDSKPCPFHSMTPNWDKPCWSLTALLEIVKKQGPLPYKNGLVFPCIEISPQYSVEYSNANGDVACYYEADNLVDACYEMIVNFNGQNLL